MSALVKRWEPRLSRSRDLPRTALLTVRTSAADNDHLVGSMGRVGAACDHAAMESFFSLLQKVEQSADLLGTDMAAAVRVQNRPCRAPERDGVADRGRGQSSVDPTRPA